MGGRGASYDIPSGEGNNYSSNQLGTRVAETLREALGTKGREIGMVEAYKEANPNHSNYYSDYAENCQRCVVAYELRRRGYNVTAQPTYKGDTMPQTMPRKNSAGKEAKWGNWQKAFQKAKSIPVGAITPEKINQNITKKMKEFGNGSRGVVSITYKGKHFGHVFNVENRNGTMYYVDAQVGKRVRPNEFFKIVKKSNVTLVRTDNLRIKDSTTMKGAVTTEYARKKKK